MTTQEQKQDEAAITAVVDGVSAAWNAADPDAFVAEYLEEATAIIPGMLMKSRQEIHGAMSFSFNGPLKGTRASSKILDIKFLNDDAALVISETGTLIPGEDAAPPERTSFAFWVLARRDGKWQLAAYSNTPSVMPAPQG